MGEDKGFTVKDRRFFSEENQEEKKDKAQPAPAPEEPGPGKENDRGPEPEAAAEHVLPEVNFATFIVSLSSSVLVALGEIEDPATGQPAPNRQMAKHTIDILGLLDEKTRGNLNADEENLLKNMLYDLRMRYVRRKW